MTDREHDAVRAFARSALPAGAELAGYAADGDFGIGELSDSIFSATLEAVDARDDLCHLDAAAVSDVAYEVAADAVREYALRNF